jgi:hypothetical protein
MNHEAEIEAPKRDFDHVRWSLKDGVTVDNGSSTHIPVWVSSDGTLVLPMGGNGNMKAEIGSRIQMTRQMWLLCDKGDLGIITGVREDNEAAPRSWLMTMDNGSKTYVFEGEFEVVKEKDLVPAG